MVGQPGTADAVRVARDNPGLRVGWHLHLDNSQPVTCAAWPWGNSYRRAGWAIGLSPRARQLMREEVRAQWELFRETGLTCAFVNSHHHLHAHPFVYQILLDVVKAIVDWLAAAWQTTLFLSQPRCGLDGTRRLVVDEAAAAALSLSVQRHLVGLGTDVSHAGR